MPKKPKTQKSTIVDFSPVWSYCVHGKKSRRHCNDCLRKSLGQNFSDGVLKGRDIQRQIATSERASEALKNLSMSLHVPAIDRRDHEWVSKFRTPIDKFLKPFDCHLPEAIPPVFL
jgi:hypothetical protein